MTEDGKTEKKPEAAPLPPIAGKAKDLEALRNTVVDAANVSGALWFSYLFVLLYLVVAVGSVTHRNLFFETAVKLPFLGVELPLVGFFTLGPAIFLVLHAYVLLHFAMLADKVGAFHAELQAQIADDDIRTRLRRQLPSNIFVQFLAGPRELRTGLMGLMLRLIALISLVIGPLALLVFMQLQFLAYHDEPILWWQRIAVVFDLALLWALWPSVARGETTSLGWRDLRRAGVIAAVVASLVPLLLVFTIATFPGEWLHKNPLSLPIIPQASTESGATAASMRWITPHQFLVAGDVNLVARRPTSLWSNRLVLPNLEQPDKNFSARGRRLEGAVLLSASLQKVDFTAARLQGAILNEADLTEAKFLCASGTLKVGASELFGTGSSETDRECARLDGAHLSSAKLRNADLERASLQRTRLSGADLQNASLQHANLKGATFSGANLTNANLWSVEAQGASFWQARLPGARLEQAKMQGANFERANLQGAYAAIAHFEGATFAYGELQGISFSGSHLDAATFDGAQLQGADLTSAVLAGASFRTPVSRRTDVKTANLSGAILVDANLDGAVLESVEVWRTELREGDNRGTPRVANLRFTAGSDDDYAALRQTINTQVPDGTRRADALKRIAVLDPHTEFDERESAKSWADLGDASAPIEAFYAKRALRYRQVGCDASNGTFAIEALSARLGGNTPPENAAMRPVAQAFRNGADCAAANGLSGFIREFLR